MQTQAEKPVFKEIDVEAVIASKSKNLARFIPGFLVNYLKRTIHQDEINAAITGNQDKLGLPFIDEMLKIFGVNVKTSGIENLDRNGRYIIAANHPLGGLDGMALMKVAGAVNPNIVFPVNDLLMNLPNLTPMFIPVNKHGSNIQNVRVMDETFASDKWMLYFPAGLCSRKQKGKILDLQWKKTFITKARQHQRDIIPTHIDGRNSDFFYNLANIRKFLRIRANIEMLYLPDEMFNQRTKGMVITFGKPVPWQTFDKRFSDGVWADLMKEHVYEIGRKIDDFDQIIRKNIA
jgi:putative hemolysin